jgi:hypothetical protein
VLLDGRVESDGLLGFGVRIDDGFLDQGIETCCRDPGRRGRLPCLEVRLSCLVTFPPSSTQQHRSPSPEVLGSTVASECISACIDLLVQLERPEGKPSSEAGSTFRE